MVRKLEGDPVIIKRKKYNEYRNSTQFYQLQ